MSEPKTVGVILSGAGHLDGAEIHESVLCLLALSQANATVKIFAPEKSLDAFDHKSGQASGETRNVLVEAARIARGAVEPLADVKGSSVDAWVLPGGFGAAKNLSDFAKEGAAATADKDVARVLRDAFAAQIPVAACCIAPAVLSAVTKKSGPKLKLTIGNDGDTAKALRAMGAEHVDAAVTDIVIDVAHKVVTTPAYMYADASVAEVFVGIQKMIDQVVAWAQD